MEKSSLSDRSLYLFDDLTDLSESGQMVLRDTISDEPADGAPSLPFDLIQSLQLSLMTGDDKLINEYLSRLSAYPMTLKGLTSQKTAECSLAAAVPLFVMAAIACGASSSKAYALLNAVLKKIYEAGSLQQVQELSRDAAFQFQQLVNEGREAGSSSDHIRALKAYVFNHLNQPLSPGLLASQMGLSKEYLMRLFMQKEGTTLMQFVKAERLKAAALLIKCSSENIGDIAAQFQFKSPRHFATEFKKLFGATPTAYRRKFREETEKADLPG